MTRAVTKEIAGKLNETHQDGIRKIDLLIKLLGVDFVNGLVEESLKIEAQGGEMVKDGSRRRTLGGVFLNLAKAQISPEQRKIVFPYPKKKKKKSSSAPIDPAS